MSLERFEDILVNFECVGAHFEVGGLITSSNLHKFLEVGRTFVFTLHHRDFARSLRGLTLVETVSVEFAVLFVGFETEVF